MLVQFNEARLAHAIDRLLFLAHPVSHSAYGEGQPLNVGPAAVVTYGDLIVAGLVDATLIGRGVGLAPLEADLVLERRPDRTFMEGWATRRP